MYMSNMSRNTNLYGYPLPKALQSKTKFVDSGVGHGQHNKNISYTCPISPNSSTNKYPCGFRNFH